MQSSVGTSAKCIYSYQRYLTISWVTPARHKCYAFTLVLMYSQKPLWVKPHLHILSVLYHTIRRRFCVRKTFSSRATTNVFLAQFTHKSFQQYYNGLSICYYYLTQKPMRMPDALKNTDISTDTISSFLTSIGLPMYTSALSRSRGYFNVPSLRRLTEARLEELGIAPNHRGLLLEQIRRTK